MTGNSTKINTNKARRPTMTDAVTIIVEEDDTASISTEVVDDEE